MEKLVARYKNQILEADKREVENPFGDYEELLQPELMERLAEAGIKVTTQTLRNWERSGLIIPPRREGGRGGKKSFYSEYVLAECYAANMLLQEKLIVGTGIVLPRVSAESLSKARKSCRYYPLQYPCPPRDQHIYYYDQKNNSKTQVAIRNETIKKIPADYQAVPEQGGMEAFKNYEEKMIHYYSEFLQLLWFRFITEGCEQFLQKYRRM